MWWELEAVVGTVADGEAADGVAAVRVVVFVHGWGMDAVCGRGGGAVVRICCQSV